MNCMQRMARGWRILLTFWRNPASTQKTASGSTETEFLLSFPIRFTTDTFAMAVKSTRANTSQSSQRKFLIKSKKFYGKEESRRLKRKCQSRLRDFFVAVSAAWA